MTTAITKVHFSDQASAARRALPEKLRVILNKAAGVLAADPYDPRSEEVAPGCRRVRASQSLTLTYRTEGAQVLVTEVERHERADAPPQEDHLE